MKYFSLAISTLLLASCTTSAIEEFDVVKTWKSDEPSAAEQFRYYNSNAFDVHLHRSLKTYEKVTVSMGSANISPSDLPNRLEKWVSSVQSKGGEVNLCRIESGVGIAGILNALTYVFGAYSQIREYYTYTPASKHNANILVSAEQPNRIVSLEFVAKNSTDAKSRECSPY